MKNLITKTLTNGKTVLAYQSEIGVLAHTFFTDLSAQKKVDELKSLGIDCYFMIDGRNRMIYILNR